MTLHKTYRAASFFFPIESKLAELAQNASFWAYFSELWAAMDSFMLPFLHFANQLKRISIRAYACTVFTKASLGTWLHELNLHRAGQKRMSLFCRVVKSNVEKFSMQLSTMPFSQPLHGHVHPGNVRFMPV
jgi:hypothetical protein